MNECCCCRRATTINMHSTMKNWKKRRTAKLIATTQQLPFVVIVFIVESLFVAGCCWFKLELIFCICGSLLLLLSCFLSGRSLVRIAKKKHCMCLTIRFTYTKRCVACIQRVYSLKTYALQMSIFVNWPKTAKVTATTTKLSIHYVSYANVQKPKTMINRIATIIILAIQSTLNAIIRATWPAALFFAWMFAMSAISIGYNRIDNWIVPFDFEVESLTSSASYLP